MTAGRCVGVTQRHEDQKESHRKSMRMIVLILQLGITMLTAIFLSGLLGKLLADSLHNLLIFPLFLLLGILAGFRSSYHMILRFTSLKNPEETRLAPDFDGWSEENPGMGFYSDGLRNPGEDTDEGDEADDRS